MGNYRCLIQIFVSDLDRAIEWYRDILGMVLISKYEKWKSATMRIGGVDFDICQPIPKWGPNWIKAKRNIGGLRGIFFYTKDIHKSYQLLKSKGVRFTKPPFKTPWGEYKANFLDIDGNEFSLCQGEAHYN
jgi:catechol 2,3-dioxygenase-like lactoylglutathione lyase family enzyme